MEKTEAIKILSNIGDWTIFHKEKEAFDMAIEALKDQRPHGEWLYHLITTECPFCNRRYRREDLPDENFCPNCGADMR